MKIWVDDVRPAPDGYVWIKRVNQAKSIIFNAEWGFENDGKEWTGKSEPIEVIDIDHDAGDYACYGGDYIKLLDWLEETHRNYPIHIHSMNSVGIENMRTIIKRNGWGEV